MLKRSMVLVAALSMAACSGEMVDGPEVSGELTYEQFLSNVFRDPSGVFIVDGDTPVENEKQLIEFYENLIREQNGQKLAVHRSGGVDAKWNDVQKLNLTYCISTKFGTKHQTVVQAMASASEAWMAVANVRFVYQSDRDDNCTSSTTAVVFDVNPVNVKGEYLARAFFPNQGRASRNVLIDNTAFTTSGNPTLIGILRHELGHTLGFRHEHTRPESGTCFEDNNYRTLTSYDPNSVMHYPQCNGTAGWGLHLSSLDIEGAQLLYGAPPSAEPEPEPEPTPVDERTRETLTGQVTKSGTKQFGPFKVEAKTLFDVEMSGSGDPDLYVRFGSAPTTTSYNCRPYKAGAAETCSLSVPEGQTEAFIMVRGYTASSFTLDLAYTQPKPAPVDETEIFSVTGNVAKSASVHHGPLSVLPGSTILVEMSGTGDADLYVRFGSKPTTSSFNCRPYQDGSAESCMLEVPENQTQAFIMVRGYTASNYKVEALYTPNATP